MIRGPLILGAVVLGLAALAWALAGSRVKQAESIVPEVALPANVPALPPAVAAASGVVVAWTAHAGARLEPCGCVAGMHGGLVRRASLLARVPAARRLTLELGGWSGGSADYQRERAGFYLAGLAAAGYDALAIGGPEIALGRDALAGLLARRGTVPALCANLRGEGLDIVSHAVSSKDGQRFAVTAVAGAHARGAGLTVEDPAEALVRLLPTLGDLPVVVLADLAEDGLVDLARAVPGLALVVGGDVRQPSATVLAVGACRVIHVANEGKTLGWWPWRDTSCAFELIEDRVPDHPAVRALIRQYQQRLGAMDLDIDDRGGMTALGVEATGARYVGSPACIACHANAAAVHAASRHAHAFATLERKHYHRDPDCLRCHVTGLALPDGYRRAHDRPELAEVSCESCHGRGSLHVAERQAGRPASGTLTPVTPATCMRCHDRENSPHFVYDPYWEKIRHDSR